MHGTNRFSRDEQVAFLNRLRPSAQGKVLLNILEGSPRRGGRGSVAATPTRRTTAVSGKQIERLGADYSRYQRLPASCSRRGLSRASSSSRRARWPAFDEVPRLEHARVTIASVRESQRRSIERRVGARTMAETHLLPRARQSASRPRPILLGKVVRVRSCDCQPSK